MHFVLISIVQSLQKTFSYNIDTLQKPTVFEENPQIYATYELSLQTLLKGDTLSHLYLRQETVKYDKKKRKKS